MEPETQRQIDETMAKYQPAPHQPPLKQSRPVIRRDPFSIKSVAQKTNLGLGVVLTVYGIAGFALPTLWGAHLGTVQNVIHLAAGLIALWFGAGRSATAAKQCCRILGAFFMPLAVAGLILGGGNADSLWVLIPNSLQMGTTDHFVHFIFGAVFMIGAFFTLRKKNIVYH